MFLVVHDRRQIENDPVDPLHCETDDCVNSTRKKLANNRLSLFWVFQVLLLISICFPTISLGQFKYSPEHPEVKAMADRAVASLQKFNGKLPKRTLAALAIVEHAKRYSGTIPSDNPVVKKALEEIVAECPLEGETAKTILEEPELYFPSLAIILMAETDAQKYKPQIDRMLQMMVERQRPNGAFTYLHLPTTGDTSQTQFAALAMFVTKHHGFNVDVEMAARTLQWIIGSQQQQGNWVYILKNVKNNPRAPGVKDKRKSPESLPMQAAGGGTAYLLSDFLQLNKRAKSMSEALKERGIGLPKSVSAYVKPLDGEASLLEKQGPLVKFDRGRLNNAVRAGNKWLEDKFKVDPGKWTYYYLYALERYAYFREQAEGDLGNGKLKNWYDQAVEYLKSQQNSNGSMSGAGNEKGAVSTALAVLVLVRSSEVISEPNNDSVLTGTDGLQSDVVIDQENGKVRVVGAEHDLRYLLDSLEDGDNAEQLQRLSNSLKKQIGEFRQEDSKSRGKIKSFLKSMITAQNYFRRLIAVRFLAAEQDMDNVPALLYAVGDPDFRICLEAHDGLRLISRKIDSIEVSAKTRANSNRVGILSEEEISLCRIEFDSIKDKWTDWFLTIRPGAELLD